MKINKIKNCPLRRATSYQDLGRSLQEINEQKEEFSFKKCSYCGLIWLTPSPYEKELEDIYAQHPYHFSSPSLWGKIVGFYNDTMFRLDAGLIEGYIKKGTVLDFGCGGGGLLLALSGNWGKFGFDPYLTDKDRRIVVKKIKGPVSTTLKDYKDGTFDLIIMRNVLEHTLNFYQLLSSAHRLLKENGLLYIKTPNGESLDCKIFKSGWYSAAMGGHIVFFSQPSLRKLATKCQFKSVLIKSTLMSTPFSFKRSIEVKFGYKRPQFFGNLLIPLSILFSIFSIFYRNGSEVVGIFQKRPVK